MNLKFVPLDHRYDNVLPVLPRVPHFQIDVPRVLSLVLQRNETHSITCERVGRGAINVGYRLSALP